ncbi:MAG TPA: hypothetical protein VNW97_21145 [Candidatus Saccharimonadales bacterium]|jgi:hypothetical protein|nr:hypothetical protein [Candidatus Saccharimonadales bacterium]
MVEGQVSVYIFNNCLSPIQSGWVNIQIYNSPTGPSLNGFSFNALAQGSLAYLGAQSFTAERIAGGYLPSPFDRELWRAGITLANTGNSQYESGPFKRCDLEARDNNRSVVLMVSENKFTIGMISGPLILGACQASMQPEQNIVLAGPVYVYVFNNCLQTIQSGNWSYQCTGGNNVSSGISTIAKGSIGPVTMIDSLGTDAKWSANVVLADGSRFYTSRIDNFCNMSTEDGSRYAILMVSESSLEILKDSGPCNRPMQKA